MTYLYSSGERLEHEDYILPAVFQMLGKHARGNQILELGCGNGAVAGQLAARGFTVTGVDASESGIAIAATCQPECRFVQGDVTLPMPQFTSAFDVVLAIETIEHLLEPRGLLDTARTALKPSGCLILTTPYHGYLKNVALAVTGRLDQHFTVLWDGGHVKFFSTHTLETMLREQKFQLKDLAYAGRIPLLWKSMIAVARPAPDLESVRPA